MSNDSMENRRRAFRVAVTGARHQIEIGRMPECQLLDANSDGLATLVVPDLSFEIGSTVQVVLSLGRRVVTGFADVRNITEVSPGTYRCGLQMGADAAELKRALHELAMDTQRAQLRRNAEQE